MIIRFRDEMEMRIRNALAISKRAVENYHGRIIGISGEVSALVGRQGIEGREVITWMEGGGGHVTTISTMNTTCHDTCFQIGINGLVFFPLHISRVIQWKI